MYSEDIKPKVEQIFSDLQTKIFKIVDENHSANDAVNKISQRVSSEISTRSKTILSDMLFHLSDKLFQTPFFSDIAMKNEFRRLNLRQEILSKYEFKTNIAIDYQEASRVMHAAKVGCGVIAVGGVADIGYVLIAGLSFSSLVAPVPVGIIVAAALGAALIDYYFIEPDKNKKKFHQAINQYLVEAQQQFLNWFDEIEKYFNKRTNEIKDAIQSNEHG